MQEAIPKIKVCSSRRVVHSFLRSNLSVLIFEMTNNTLHSLDKFKHHIIHLEGLIMLTKLFVTITPVSTRNRFSDILSISVSGFIARKNEGFTTKRKFLGLRGVPIINVKPKVVVYESIRNH